MSNVHRYYVCPDDDPSPGDRLNEYVLGDLVMSTAMSAIFICTSEETGEKFVCKCIRRLVNRETRLEAEMQMHQALSHTSIVSVVDAFQIERHGVLIMPLARFGSLTSFIKERYPVGVPETMARVMVVQMLQALQYLHDQNIIHCDIKCSNILVVSDDMLHPQVQLCDFGIAQHIGPDELIADSSGTVTHKAPEMWLEHVRGKCSDIWALGVAVFEMLVGYCPFELTVRTQKGRQRLSEDIIQGPKMREKDWCDISPEGRAFVKRLLTVDRSERPTVSEALDDEWLIEVAEKMTDLEGSIGSAISHTLSMTPDDV